MHRFKKISWCYFMQIVKEFIKCFHLFFWWNRSLQKGTRKSFVLLSKNHSLIREVQSIEKVKWDWLKKELKVLPLFLLCLKKSKSFGKTLQLEEEEVLHSKSSKRKQGKCTKTLNILIYSRTKVKFQNSEMNDSILDCSRDFLC